MNTDDDDCDSVLRAIAAAPPMRPPVRVLTAMVVGPGELICADHLTKLRQLVEKGGGNLTVHDDGLACVIWEDAARGATVAIELREALPMVGIALATGNGETAWTPAFLPVVERATAILASAGSGKICLDESTAKLVEPQFDLKVTDDGTPTILVGPKSSEATALTGRVLGNYKIVRLLGTGGMGVVYLAEHVTLGRKAVIKFVQERHASDTNYIQRFLTEATTAASIRHPGIVDVFDYGKDDEGRGYIVMELLEGESLRTRLHREKSLSPELALALGAQIASGLDAAHTGGVIHRDLKPDNVFLVPDRELAHRVRAKVLDFGIAKAAAAGAPAITQTGNLIGTPLYMSPEQSRSKAEIDHRTDIYSLGCILFEMVCGRPPFLDETVGDLILAHNARTPPPPSEFAPTIAPAFERAILRALAKDPDDRFPTMAAFYDELSRLGTHPSGSPTVLSAIPSTPKRTLLRQHYALVAAFVLLAVAVAMTVVQTQREAKKQAAVAGEHRAIALVELDNLSKKPETAWLATAVGEVIASDLQSAKDMRVLPPDEVARLSSPLGSGNEWSREKLSRMRRALGASYVIAGSYIASGAGAQLRVNVKLYDTSSGELVAQFSEIGQESDLVGVSTRIASGIRRELDIGTTDIAPSANSALPTKASVAKLYYEGLAKLRKLELTEARDLLKKAVVEEPNDPLIHSALATTWRELGYDNKARTEAKLAYDFASSLPRENQLAIEAQYRESSAQWGQAIKAYQTLFDFFPERLEYGLALAAVQTHSGDAKSAYSTLAMLRKRPAPLGSDPRIDLAEASAAEEADDMERVRANAERAVQFARSRGAHQLLAKALLKEGWALWTLGRDEAASTYEEAKQIFSELGDRNGLAATLNNIGLAQHRNHLDFEATQTFAEALKLAEDVGNTQTQAWILNNWGYVLADAGDLGKALELTQRKLELGGERGDGPASQAAAHVNISEILRWRGELDGARKHCNAAEDLLRGLDARRFASFAALQCGELLRAEDDLDGAKKRLEQAVMWASDVMTPAESAEMRIAMARLELDRGRASDAEALARAALADLRSAKEGSQQVCGISVLALALLQRGMVAEAATEISTTNSLPSEGVSFACRLDAEITAARIQAAEKIGNPAQVLDSVRIRAGGRTFVQLEMHSRLALGQVQGAEGRETLRKLARDARGLGFKQIARLATFSIR